MLSNRSATFWIPVGDQGQAGRFDNYLRRKQTMEDTEHSGMVGRRALSDGDTYFDVSGAPIIFLNIRHFNS